jgi:hypothetical protein
MLYPIVLPIQCASLPQENCTLYDVEISYAFTYVTITVPKYVQYGLLKCNATHIRTEHQTQTVRENLQKI